MVTEFEYRLHPVGPEVMTLNTFYPIEAAEYVFSAWLKFTRSAPDEATTAFAIYDRLVSIKGKYDPSNRFRFNQNIKPVSI